MKAKASEVFMDKVILKLLLWLSMFMLSAVLLTLSIFFEFNGDINKLQMVMENWFVSFIIVVGVVFLLGFGFYTLPYVNGGRVRGEGDDDDFVDFVKNMTPYFTLGFGIASILSPIVAITFS